MATITRRGTADSRCVDQIVPAFQRPLDSRFRGNVGGFRGNDEVGLTEDASSDGIAHVGCSDRSA